LNEEDYLERCLNSLKNQKGCDNFEIIVVDGGSSDATVKIAKKYADTTVISKERGPSKQRNLGAKMATGSLLAFIDADTVASKFWLKCIAEALQDQNVACVTGPLFPLEKIKRPYLYHIVNTLQKILVKINYPLFWGASCAFRTNAFRKIEGFDEKLFTSEDHDISLRIRKIGKVVFDNDILAFTSHRKFLENEKKAFFFYIKDIFEYFFFRKIRTNRVNSKIGVRASKKHNKTLENEN
jgi:glycosyltransferase involved in cell wall biosynthesis